MEKPVGSPPRSRTGNVPNMSQYAVHGDRVIGLLRSIATVKTLILSKSTMKALGYANNKVLSKFHNLVRLSLEVDDFFGWQLLPSFLESMPNLQVLVFSRVSFSENISYAVFNVQNAIYMFGSPSFVIDQRLVPYRHRKADWRKDEPFEFNWHAPEVVPACLLLKLQSIEIRNDGPLMKKELKLIKYLLANAVCLKTMKICGKMDEKTRKKLASYHRGSDSCQIILLKHYSEFWNQVWI